MQDAVGQLDCNLPFISCASSDIDFAASHLQERYLFSWSLVAGAMSLWSSRLADVHAMDSKRCFKEVFNKCLSVILNCSKSCYLPSPLVCCCTPYLTHCTCPNESPELKFKLPHLEATSHTAANMRASQDCKIMLSQGSHYDLKGLQEAGIRSLLQR